MSPILYLVPPSVRFFPKTPTETNAPHPKKTKTIHNQAKQREKEEKWTNPKNPQKALLFRLFTLF